MTTKTEKQETKNTEKKAPVGGQQAESGKPPAFGRDVPIDRIVADDRKNVRKAPIIASADGSVKEDLKALGESLKAGQLSPCIGRLRKDGKIELWAGFRRYEAAVMAGLKTLWVVERQGDETERLLVNLTENTARLDLTPADKARGYLTTFDAMKDKDAKLGNSKIDETIAARCGVSRTEVAQYRLFATHLTGKVFKAWRELGSQLQTKWLQGIYKLTELEQNRALEDKLRVIQGEAEEQEEIEAADDREEPTDEQKRAAKASRNPDAPPRVTKSKMEAEFSALIAHGADYLGKDVSERVSSSGKITGDWLSGATYALGFALSRHAFNPLGKAKPKKEKKGKKGKKQKEGAEGENKEAQSTVTDQEVVEAVKSAAFETLQAAVDDSSANGAAPKTRAVLDSTTT